MSYIHLTQHLNYHVSPKLVDLDFTKNGILQKSS